MTMMEEKESNDSDERCLNYTSQPQHETLEVMENGRSCGEGNMCIAVEKQPACCDARIVLYGRREEQALLLDAFHRRNRVKDRSPELVLVTGASGTGKTSLIVSTLQHEIEEHGGYFLRGKFGLLERTEAYYPFVRAFSDFVEVVLRRSDSDLPQIRQKLSSIAPAQPLLVDMIPALETLFGKATALNEHEVKATGVHKRLQFAFGEFLRAVCSTTRPVCLFLDDLQWAQPVSIDLVSFLVEENIEGLLLIGACRGQEVSLEHHLSVTLRELEANNVYIHAIVLQNLRSNAVAEMIFDLVRGESKLGRSMELCICLAELVLERTNGNTLYVVELIRVLSEENFLRADDGIDKALSKINHRLSGTLNLIEDKIQSMPRNVQQVLMLASCLGAEFDEYLVRKLISFEISDLLMSAWVRGLICRDRISGTWRFAHDQIQHATYSLVPDDEKEMAHLTIGRTLWASLTQEELESHFFLVVNQLSFGVRLMTDKEERRQFAALLVLAGQKAAQSFTFLTASSYLELGISLLEERRWRDQYDVSMELYQAAAESEYCNGHYERTDELVNEILEHARSNRDKIGALTISIYSLGSRNEMQKAVDLGITVLKDIVGHPIPANPTILRVLYELAKTKRLLQKHSDEYLLNEAPIMTDEKELAAMRIMSIIFAYTIHLRPMLGSLLAMRLVQRTILGGVSGMSAVGLASFAMILCNGFGEIKLGIRLAKLSVKVLDKFQSREWLPRVYSATYGLCYGFCDPLRDSLKPLLMAHRVGLVSGDMEFSALSAAMYIGVAMNASVPLVQFLDEGAAFLQMMKQHNQTNMAQFIVPTLQFAKCMIGLGCEDPSVLSGDVMNVSEALQFAISTNNRTIIAFIRWTQMLLASYFGDYETVMRQANKLADDCDCSNFSCYNRVNWYLHEALACYSLDSVSRPRSKKVATRNLKRLKALGSYSEHNFQAHIYLLEAEMAVAKGTFLLTRFDDAASQAEKEKLWNLAGLAHERAARALLAHDRVSDAKLRWKKAIDFYERWGATAKVARIKADLASMTNRNDVVDARAETVVC